MVKVASLYNSLNNALTKFGIFYKYLNVDESMVSFFCRYSSKMFTTEKPIRFYYKIWSLCGTDGNSYYLNIYTGRDCDASTEPLSSRVMKKMINKI